VILTQSVFPQILSRKVFGKQPRSRFCEDARLHTEMSRQATLPSGGRWAGWWLCRVAIAIMTIVWVCGGCRAEFAELRRVKKHQTMSAPLGGAYRRTGTRHHTVLEPVPSTRHSQHGPMHVQFCMPRKMLRCVRQPLSCRSHITHPRVCKKPASLLSPCKGRRVPWLRRQALRLPGPARLHRVSAANPVKMFRPVNQIWRDSLGMKKTGGYNMASAWPSASCIVCPAQWPHSPVQDSSSS